MIYSAPPLLPPAGPYTWNPAKNRAELVIPIGLPLSNFVEDAKPSSGEDFQFMNFWEDGTNQVLHSDGGHLFRSVVGAGGFTVLNGPRGGVLSTTGMVLNNSCLMRGGGGAPIMSYDVANEIHARFRFRLPNASDLANHFLIIGFYSLANHFVGLRFNSTVDANWRFVTASAVTGLITETVIAAGDNDWHNVHMILTPTSCICIMDGGASIEHTTNIPDNVLVLYIMNRNQTIADFSSLELQRVKVIQDAA